jgi:hypothetical protein
MNKTQEIRQKPTANHFEPQLNLNKMKKIVFDWIMAIGFAIAVLIYVLFG